MKYQNVKINGRWVLKLPQTRAAAWAKDWEKKRLEHMSKHLGKGDVMYYIGAEVGDIPALIQKWGAKLCLFEPNHTAWPYIKGIWKANNLERPLGLFAMFVAAETELEPKNPDKDLFNGEGWNLSKNNWPKYANVKMRKDHGFSELHNEQGGLPQVTIDDVASYTLGPTALSIDVEGAEFEVLKGAENTIMTYKPKIWLSLHPEFLINYYDTYGREVRDWIIDRGYTEKLIEYEHEVHLYYKPIDPLGQALQKEMRKRLKKEKKK